jgi:hypothetical protein
MICLTYRRDERNAFIVEAVFQICNLFEMLKKYVTVGTRRCNEKISRSVAIGWIDLVSIF